jgi:hypothetical protein
LESCLDFDLAFDKFFNLSGFEFSRPLFDFFGVVLTLVVGLLVEVERYLSAAF